MAEIKAVPLGAGQDVGRSCIIVTLGGKNIMLDCGMHMGFNDDRKFPDFSYIAKTGPYTPYIDCLIISHFHLDHCGALPYFTEMCGYDGPIYMTHPTKAICPILLEDFRKIQVERKGDSNFFTSQNIKDCMKKVVPVNLHQCVQVDDELEIKAYYAGHVIGAAMFYCRVGDQSFVYTGDYNMTPDRHLGAAWIDKCRPDLLITESTYATTIRDSKRCREMDFLKKVHESIMKGGKVLIPVFALGRAQELCILLETFWDRMNIQVPIYFSTGLTEKANHYYKLFISWTNQKIRNTFVQRNLFDFKHIKPFDRSYIDNPGAMVVFATPGMLHAGLSLQIFKKWAPDENNMLIMPGYCVIGTVGHKVLSGQKKIELDKKTVVDVKLSVQYLSFSAHADASGIMQLIRQCEPKNVMLVHGEGSKMEFLKKKINEEFHLNCFMPANGESATMPVQSKIVIDMAKGFLKRKAFNPHDSQSKRHRMIKANNETPIDGMLVMKNMDMKLLDSKTVSEELNLEEHQLRFTSSVKIESSESIDEFFTNLKIDLDECFAENSIEKLTDTSLAVDSVLLKLHNSSLKESKKGTTVKDLLISWRFEDESLGSRVLDFLTPSSEPGEFDKEF
ncbi:integrator complex subunit 11-like [Hydractinia symbiolongicarpus]|uniref:integrator complex subunit 11-like n=1 Tax=Hydractinia symbiolongicarpus TaxID=13093 RepID=UPI00254CF41A|nr:integrator complex subunit 11-like [Hydractinia symbiolongicarpus]